MEPSPKAAEPFIEEEDEDGGDESEALLGSNKTGKTPVIAPSSSAVKTVPSRDTVQVESEPVKPAAGAQRVKKPYLNTDV